MNPSLIFASLNLNLSVLKDITFIWLCALTHRSYSQKTGEGRTSMRHLILNYSLAGYSRCYSSSRAHDSLRHRHIRSSQVFVPLRAETSALHTPTVAVGMLWDSDQSQLSQVAAVVAVMLSWRGYLSKNTCGRPEPSKVVYSFWRSCVPPLYLEGFITMDLYTYRNYTERSTNLNLKGMFGFTKNSVLNAFSIG